MTDLIKKLDSLPEEKRRLALQLLEKRAKSAFSKEKPGSAVSSVKPASTVEKRTPSYSQSRLWFLHKIESDSPAYNLPMALRLDGELSVDALKKSINAVAARHEALRICFREENGKPVVEISDKAAIPFRTVKAFSNNNGAIPDVERIIADEVRDPFDLSACPLARALLIEVNGREHILVFTLHHIISDAWSNGVLANEISEHYKLFTSGAGAALPPLAVQYSDYAAWQRKRLTQTRVAELMGYWKTAMADAPQTLDLPTDRPRPAEQTFNGETVIFSVSPSASYKLSEIAQKHDASLFMALMSAFAVLLARFSGQDDVVIGYPIANRTTKEVEPLIGFFVNTLIMRARVEPEMTFSALLKQSRMRALEAYERQDMPFERLVEELSPERCLSHSPLFQTMFVWNNTPKNDATLSGLLISPMKFEAGVSHFDLTLGMSDTGAGLTGALEYNTDLFDRTTIERMVSAFVNLLEYFSRNPNARVWDAPLFGENEMIAIAEKSHGPAMGTPSEESLTRMFECAMESHPELIAIESAGGGVSYANLNMRANRIARYLQKHGAGSGAPVGIMMNRSPELMISVLAVLKAGAACLPIDHEYPAERAATMLDESGARILITDEFTTSRAKDAIDCGAKRSIIAVTFADIENDAAALSCDNLDTGPARGDLAYVLFTSGSTGKPKGVGMPHKALANLMTWQLSEPSFKARAKTLQFTTLTFDVSFQEIFSTWLSGGTLVIVPEESRRDMREILSIISERAVERVFMPFVALRQLCELSSSLNLIPYNLKEVITAGEQLRITPPISEFFKKLPGCSLSNHYGPTESHVVTACTLPHDAGTWPETPSIGKPIANSAVYILDRRMSHVPPKVFGEMYLGGACLAKGYINSEQMTKERFVPNPFSNTPGDVLYKTGDKGRYLDDGSIEFAGRYDTQVKIRGFRVEPGEIEAAISSFEGVGEAAVIAHEVSPGDKRIAAFVTSAGSAFNEAGLRDYLKSRLPEYMTPWIITQLDSMPMTSSGKIDRLALARHDFSSSAKSSSRPLTVTGEIMASIWEEILKSGKAGADTNFFEAGGHSLLATQLASRVRNVFAVELPLKSIFEFQTLESLSNFVDGLRNEARSAIPPLVSDKSGGSSQLSYAQERLWFEDQMEGPSARYNMAACLRLSGELNLTALQNSVNELVRRHEPLRSAFPSVEGQPRLLILDELKFAMEPVDLSSLNARAREDKLKELMKANSLSTFDFSRGPLFRVSLVRMDENEHVLLIAMSHIISDGWSIGIISRDLGELYTAFSKGSAPRLPELAVSYSDYARWQRSWLKGHTLEKEVAFWKRTLDGAAELFNLPFAITGHAAGETMTGGLLSFTLSAELGEKINNLSRESGASIFMTMFAAYGTMLHRLSGADNIVIGTPVANRTRREIENLVGFFVNMLPLRLDFTGDPTFAELLARTRNMALSAYDNQHASFGAIVKELNPKRITGRHPVFQVAFVLQNTPMHDLNLPGLRVQAVDHDAVMPKYDLMFAFNPAQDGGLNGVVEYNATMFTESTMKSLTVMFTAILSQVSANPQTRLMDILLSDENSQFAGASRIQDIGAGDHDEFNF